MHIQFEYFQRKLHYVEPSIFPTLQSHRRETQDNVPDLEAQTVLARPHLKYTFSADKGLL